LIALLKEFKDCFAWELWDAWLGPILCWASIAH
jgi:hypothetical protein